MSLHDATTADYYSTSAIRSHTASKEHYDSSANGLLLRLRPWLPADKGARCLDLACGCGEVAYLLEREGYQSTVGVDLCFEEIEHARAFVKGQLIHGDILAYLRRCETNSFDFITGLNILEHLNKDVLMAVLAEVARVLHPKGALVALVPNAVSPFGTLTRHWDVTHEWAFTPNNFIQLAALTGFDQRVEFRECGPVPHGLVSGIRYVMWRAIRLGIATRLMIELADTKGGVYTMDMLVRLRPKR